jgi:hypothetical protein
MAGLIAVAGVVALFGIVAVVGSSCPPSKPPPPPPPPGDRDAALRAAAVAVARNEFERVNAPGAPKANPADYWAISAQQRLTPAEIKELDWCGGFYLWALKMSGLAPRSLFWKFDGTGIGSAKLKATTDPKPADLAYFKKNQHHALIEAVDGDTIHLINGNGGGKGITRSSVSRKQVAGFYSVEPLLQQQPGGGLNA